VNRFRTAIGIMALAATALAQRAAYAASIVEAVSPTAFVVQTEAEKRILLIDGSPVLYCGLAAFHQWAARIVGAPVERTPAGVEVAFNGERVELQSLLVDGGWLRSATLTDGAQAAITERRGGWDCAPKAEPFVALSDKVHPYVLAGIAMNESAYRGRPWPWTLNVAGQGMFFATREDAHSAIQRLVAANRCDFDVGIMQVNWCYHRQRFSSAWDALSPLSNVRAAEAILTDNKQRSGSPMTAVAWYHSATPSRGGPYLARFMTNLKQLETGR
jgi:hypothetical protein